MSSSLLARIAQAEAWAHTRYGAARHFGSLTAVNAADIAVLSSAWHDGSRPPSVQELADFETLSRQHGQPPTLHLLSHAAPELLPLLTERRYQLSYVLHVYVHDLQQVPELLPLRVQPQPSSEAWAKLSAQGFGCELGIMQAVAQAKGTHLYTAFLDNLPAAGAALSLCQQVAALHGASTLSEFRGRRAQAALLAYRLRAAQQLGADFASIFVTPGTVSERNVVRAGFKLAGLRLTFVQGELG